jgi:hypothetical protein
MSEPINDGPWYAGAIGRIPEDDSLVWRDDAVFGPQFYAASPKEAETIAKILNDLEHKASTIPGLKESIDSWKDAWYSLREIVGRLSWEHSNCPHETKPSDPIKPNPWLHPEDTVVQTGKAVFLKVKEGGEWKLVGEGGSLDAAQAIVRLMTEKPCKVGDL